MITAAKNMLFITKPQADHLSCGSKSVISDWSICEVDSKVKLFFLHILLLQYQTMGPLMRSKI